MKNGLVTKYMWAFCKHLNSGLYDLCFKILTELLGTCSCFKQHPYLHDKKKSAKSSCWDTLVLVEFHPCNWSPLLTMGKPKEQNVKMKYCFSKKLTTCPKENNPFLVLLISGRCTVCVLYQDTVTDSLFS